MKRIEVLIVVWVASWTALGLPVRLAAHERSAPSFSLLGVSSGGKEDAPPAAERTYTIQPGDWLSKIAERFYGSAALWPLIYDANRDVLGPDPDIIQPGVRIRLPEVGGRTPRETPWTGTPGRRAPGKDQPAQGGPFSQRRPLEHGTVTSNFGPRVLNGRNDYHEGLDVGVPIGTRVFATGPGKVIFAGVQGGYGTLVKIRHPDGTITYFAHLQRANVRVGQDVGAGSVIAFSGNSGFSTGPHLHFAVEKNGKFVDPRQYFKFPPHDGTF